MALEDSVIDSTRISETIRLADAKEMRQKIEQEQLKLRNRLLYLQNKEAQISKKAQITQIKNIEALEKTCKRASSALTKQKTQEEKKKQHEEQSQRLKETRHTQKQRIQSAIHERRNKSLMDASKIKENSKEHNEEIATKKLEENLRKLLSRQKILNDKKQGLEKRRLKEIKEKSYVKVNTNKKIADELMKQREIERELEFMAAEEKELLFKLSMTQIFCKSIVNQSISSTVDL